MHQLQFGQLPLDHLAIMRREWGLTTKILKGEKTIESRWYLNRSRPWGNINPGDTVYFKDTGKPVRIKTTVAKVLQFENLTPEKVREIITKYGEADGLGIDPMEKEKYFMMFKDKRYCILIFLRDPQEVEPFEINKTGFGSMAAWLTTDNIDKLKKL